MVRITEEITEWNVLDGMVVTVTGMEIFSFTASLEVGKLPKITFEMSVLSFLDTLIDEELKKLFDLVKKKLLRRLVIKG